MTTKTPWNKGKIIGAKPPLTPEQTNLVRLLLANSGNLRNSTLFSLAIDTAFRGVDLVKIKVSDLMLSGEVLETIRIRQQKTGNPVSAYLTDETRDLLKRYIAETDKDLNDYLFTRKKGDKKSHITSHRYRELLNGFLLKAGLPPEKYGTHSLRRTKTSYIYKKTGNLRACQKILGHKSIQNTANYLGIEEAEAFELAKEFKI